MHVASRSVSNLENEGHLHAILDGHRDGVEALYSRLDRQHTPSDYEVSGRFLRDQPRSRLAEEDLPKRPRHGHLDARLDGVVLQGLNRDRQSLGVTASQ